jgi:ATP-dependent DNA helicase RecG
LSLFEEGKHPAQQRLVIEELLAHHLSVLKVRQQSRQQATFPIKPSADLLNQFLKNLPFKPTGAQQRVVGELQEDMQQNCPMMRLIQGDVGSGKTLVAAMAALSTIAAGYQVGMMAPTELLAEQHFNNFRQWFEPLGIEVGWLAGKLKGKVRVKALEQLANNEVKMLVGTHAIFQEAVTFSSLALVIVDEQHRFGVHQRLALREKGESQGAFPHQLIMTATPIPRTLAMTAYADLDTSVIDELPPGRKPVKTVVLPDTRRDEVINRVREVSVEQGRQTYWVCTLIDESEFLQSQAAEDTAILLRTALPELKVGLVHGRLKSDEKQQIMADFKAGALDLLVATTVIEVGVDVPNASLMIIENPERLGLAQLHQLRGRVGRGSVESHCVLMYQSPLSKTANKRLSVLRESTDGFYIAQQDLEIRGPGELLGTKQTGLADLKIADLIRDAELIPQVQNIANHLWDQFPSNAQAIVNRWLGNKEHFGHA